MATQVLPAPIGASSFEHVWSDTPVAQPVDMVQYSEETLFSERLLLSDLALERLQLLRISYLKSCVGVFGIGAAFLLLATVMCLIKGIMYQPPVACFFAVLGIVVVFLMKIYDARKKVV